MGLVVAALAVADSVDSDVLSVGLVVVDVDEGSAPPVEVDSLAEGDGLASVDDGEAVEVPAGGDPLVADADGDGLGDDVPALGLGEAVAGFEDLESVLEPFGRIDDRWSSEPPLASPICSAG